MGNELKECTVKMIAFLKDYANGKDFEKGAIIGLGLMSEKKEGFADRLIAYCQANPNADSSDVLLAAANIYNEIE